MGKTLDFIFNLDVFMSNGFGQKVSQATQTLTTLQQKTQELQRVSGKIDGYRAQEHAIAQTSGKLSGLRESLSRTQVAAQTSKQTTQLLSEQYKQAQARVQDLSGKYPRQSMVMKLARHEAARLKEAYSQSEGMSQKLTRESERLSGQVKKVEQSLAGEQEKLQTLQSGLREAGVDTQNLSRQQREYTDAITRSQKAQERYNAIRGQLSWGNVKSAIAEAAPVVMTVKPMVKLAADFEAAMARVKAVAFTNEGADMSQFDRLSAQAKQLGADTKYTSIQAAGAQENLLRANMSPQDVLKALPSVLNMAAAEDMPLEQAGAIIAKGLGGMNLGGELAPRLADILAYTSANSNTNIAMIGEAFKVAAPVFAGQGATMEQIASYIGIMANKGFEGSEAGNALASAAMRISKPTAESAGYLRELGVATQTREGRMRELPDIMKELSKGMTSRKWGEAQQLAALSAIFGKNYGKQMMAFMAASASGDTDKLQAGVYNESYGRAKKMADINLETLNGQLDILSSSWDGLRTTIGEIFSPYVRKGVELLSSALTNINNLMKEFPILGKAVTFAMTGAFGSVALRKIWNIGSALVQLPGAWLDVAKATKGATAALEGASKGASLFGANLGTALGTLGLIAGACYLIYTYWDDITAAAERAGQAISSIDTSKFEAAKAGTLSRSDADYGLAVMNSTYMPPSIPAHAFGGILTTPHVGLVAEAGPEAIIPLRDKSRGIPLVQKAASILGLGQVPQVPSLSVPSFSLPSLSLPSLSTPTISPLKEANDFVRQYSHSNNYSVERNRTGNSVVVGQSPTINITVNGGGQDPESLASRIAEAVSEVLRNMQSLEERISYA